MELRLTDPSSWAGWLTNGRVGFECNHCDVDESGEQFLFPNPGDYRIRVHGRNRDDGDPRVASDPVEEYLIQVWPAPAGGPELWKATSRTAARWRTP